MTITFFITPVDPKAWEDTESPPEKPTSDLYVEKTGFHEALLHQFPETKHDDEWHFWQLDKGENKGIRIYLTSRNKEGWGFVSFSPYGANLIEFILWYRRFVPEKYTLYFFNSSSWDSLILKPDTLEIEIQTFIGLKSD